MARSIREIKKSMTDMFMADADIREKYGLTGTQDFESAFSRVSVESILFFIVASAAYVLETLFDRFKTDVDAKISTAVLATIPWYHQVCLEYQHGDDMVFDETTQQFAYAETYESRRVVKFAACRDIGGGVYVLVAGESAEGRPEALSNDVLTAFEAYLRKRKPAGVLLEVHSYDPDDIRLALKVQYDPMLLSSDGSLISDPSVKPVEDAVNGYLAGIVYGGVFNKTRLVDAVQAAEGVKDVVLTAAAARPAGTEAFTDIQGNNHQSFGGSFEAYQLSKGVDYVLSL